MTSGFVFVSGILAAACNALSSVLQRMAAGRPDVQELFSSRLFIAVTTNSQFLTGLGLQIIAAVLQAAALSAGPLTLVEPLLTLDLVCILLILYFKFQRQVGWREWLAVAAIISGLALAIYSAQPSNGSPQYAMGPWIFAVSVASFFMLLGLFGAHKVNSVLARTALVAFATATAYAITAALAKLIFLTVHAYGLSALYLSWPLYVFIAFGIFSIYLMQNAYAAGPLIISQPVIEVVGPVFSIALGIFVLREHVLLTTQALYGEVIGLAVLLWGVYRLATSKRLTVDR